MAWRCVSLSRQLNSDGSSQTGGLLDILQGPNIGNLDQEWVETHGQTFNLKGSCGVCLWLSPYSHILKLFLFFLI